MKAEPGDKRLGCHHLDNIQKAVLIKKLMVEIHDEIKADGIYPTLRKILRAMPFHVGESWGSELRRELIEDGLIPPPPRGCTKSAQDSAAHRIVHAPSLDEINERKLEINEEHIARMREDEIVWDGDRMTPKQASEWARRRYKAAWESVRAISRHRRCWAFLAHPETVRIG